MHTVAQAHIVEDVQRDEELPRLQHRVRAELVAQAALLPRLQRQVLQLQCTETNVSVPAPWCCLP